MANNNRIKMGYLNINGKHYNIYKGINTIGRHKDAIVILKDPEVSQQQAIITIVNENLQFISDAKSSNGTRLSNVTLNPLELYSLHHGNSIKFANSQHAVYYKRPGTESLNQSEVANYNNTQIDHSVFSANTQLLSTSQTLERTSTQNDKTGDINDATTHVISIHDLPTQVVNLESVNHINIDDEKTQVDRLSPVIQVNPNQEATQVSTLSPIIHLNPDEEATQIATLSPVIHVNPDEEATQISRLSPVIRLNTDDVATQFVRLSPVIDSNHEDEATQVCPIHIPKTQAPVVLQTQNNDKNVAYDVIEISDNDSNSGSLDYENIPVEEIVEKFNKSKDNIKILKSPAEVNKVESNSSIQNLLSTSSPSKFKGASSHDSINSEEINNICKKYEGTLNKSTESSNDSIYSEEINNICKKYEETLNKTTEGSNDSIYSEEINNICKKYEETLNKPPKGSNDSINSEEINNICKKYEGVLVKTTESSNDSINSQEINDICKKFEESLNKTTENNEIVNKTGQTIVNTDISSNKEESQQNVEDNRKTETNKITETKNASIEYGEAHSSRDSIDLLEIVAEFDRDLTDTPLEDDKVSEPNIKMVNEEKRFYSDASTDVDEPIKNIKTLDINSQDDDTVARTKRFSKRVSFANLSTSESEDDEQPIVRKRSRIKEASIESSGSDTDVDEGRNYEETLNKINSSSEFDDSYVKPNHTTNVSYDEIPATQEMCVVTSVSVIEHSSTKLENIMEVTETSIENLTSVNDTMCGAESIIEDSETYMVAPTQQIPTGDVNQEVDFNFVLPNDTILSKKSNLRHSNGDTFDDATQKLCSQTSTMEDDTDFDAVTQKISYANKNCGDDDDSIYAAKTQKICLEKAATQKLDVTNAISITEIEEDFNFVAPAERMSTSLSKSCDFDAPTQKICEKEADFVGKNTSFQNSEEFDFAAETQKLPTSNDNFNKKDKDFAIPTNKSSSKKDDDFDISDDEDDDLLFKAATQKICSNKEKVYDFEAATQKLDMTNAISNNEIGDFNFVAPAERMNTSLSKSCDFDAPTQKICEKEADFVGKNTAFQNSEEIDFAAETQKLPTSNDNFSKKDKDFAIPRNKFLSKKVDDFDDATQKIEDVCNFMAATQKLPYEKNNLNAISDDDDDLLFTAATQKIGTEKEKNCDFEAVTQKLDSKNATSSTGFEDDFNFVTPTQRINTSLNKDIDLEASTRKINETKSHLVEKNTASHNSEHLSEPTQLIDDNSNVEGNTYHFNAAARKVGALYNKSVDLFTSTESNIEKSDNASFLNPLQKLMDVFKEPTQNIDFQEAAQTSNDASKNDKFSFGTEDDNRQAIPNLSELDTQTCSSNLNDSNILFAPTENNVIDQSNLEESVDMSSLFIEPTEKENSKINDGGNEDAISANEEVKEVPGESNVFTKPEDKINEDCSENGKQEDVESKMEVIFENCKQNDVESQMEVIFASQTLPPPVENNERPGNPLAEMLSTQNVLDVLTFNEPTSNKRLSDSVDENESIKRIKLSDYEEKIVPIMNNDAKLYNEKSKDNRIINYFKTEKENKVNKSVNELADQRLKMSKEKNDINLNDEKIAESTTRTLRKRNKSDVNIPDELILENYIKNDIKVEKRPSSRPQTRRPNQDTKEKFESKPKKTRGRKKKEIIIDDSDEEFDLLVPQNQISVKIADEQEMSKKEITVKPAPKRGRPRKIIIISDSESSTLSGPTTSSKRMKKEPLDDTRSCSTPERSKRKQRMKIVFTMLDDPHLKSLIKNIGGLIVDTVEEANCLVTLSVLRSKKLLSAIGQCIPICSPDWLFKCKEANSFIDPWENLIQDDLAERKWNFSLKESYNRSKTTKLFENYSFHVLVNNNIEDVIKGAILSCGGKCVQRAPKSGEFIVVATNETKSKCTKYIKQNMKIVLPEAILEGVLKQEILLNEYLLKW